jgi:hypothetical protein
MPIQNTEKEPMTLDPGGLKLVHEQLKQVLLAQKSLDDCEIPRGYTDVPLFADNKINAKRDAVFARLGSLYNLNNSEDRDAYYHLCLALVNFMRDNKDNSSFNTEIANIICHALILIPFSRERAMIGHSRNRERTGMRLGEYIKEKESIYEQCDKLARELIHEFNLRAEEPRTLTFSTKTPSEDIKPTADKSPCVKKKAPSTC